MKVLFVDDEPQVLKGIERMLEAADVDWEVETATSGKEALELLAEEPADVVVSDMRMPGMDGAELLTEVSKKYPETVRIILSGQADKDAVFRAVQPMHQYLAKPCEASVLRDVIARACSLRETLEQTRSHELLSSINSLPSLPELYQQVKAEMEDPDGTLERVGEIISQDPAMTAKILQLANSAMFGLRSQVTSTARAASLLGMDVLKSLVLSLGVFKSFDGAAIPGFSIEQLFQHSLQVATLAKNIASKEQLGKEIAGESFTAGLLHDVGKLVLATSLPDQFTAAIQKAKAESIPPRQAEREILGLSHEHIGGHLLALWGIPQSIVEAVCFHHRDRCESDESLNPGNLVTIANILVNQECNQSDPKSDEALTELLDAMKCNDRVESWRKLLLVAEEAC